MTTHRDSTIVRTVLNALAEAFGTMPANAGEFEIDAWLEKEASFLRAGDAETLARAVDRRLDAAPEKPDRLLIYVDQWEELYAMAPQPEDKARLEQHSADVARLRRASGRGCVRVRFAGERRPHGPGRLL